MDISQELAKIPKEELKALTEKSDFHGFKSLFINWFLVCFSFFIVGYEPHVLTILVAMIILGGRILGLAILMHDASHNALFKTSGFNTFFGKWFCAAPILADLDGYRTYHLKHHHKAGTEEDPDRSNYINYPVKKESMRRKVFRDLTGITGLKTLVILYKMSAGLIAYQLSYDQVSLQKEKEAFYKPMGRAIKNLFPNILVNGLMLGILWGMGKPLLFLL